MPTALTVLQILQLIAALTQTVQELLATYQPDAPIELSEIGKQNTAAGDLLKAYLQQQAGR